ncbi:potassium-transporting ATPase subunit KdpA [Acidocella aminolytica]|jgi:K+-transporting ATPase ATPase A chain|uniref:Potassium-transporting ATPase potassium-binding subunit n=1 Tax=Acidocella aminolytica 101 = DSM 11237 TaxID=1120923 RepID=A0A0D6PH78_9PROT|nr:potassium-transporting ATPase subunit KdpA [Acidocella aminolytica]GAN81032.1 potassium transporter ATPase subunit A [Acidocella aminolytica 101 = DSM 11237]GBQ42727.1 potassium-transporting ATPase subunit A [Acidocella aminolytica 101 = DSM 11237]SHF18985.1 K+-transporting ATPase ATPase A chain [Acidocella aminolytica 101 = DSM 11237]
MTIDGLLYIALLFALVLGAAFPLGSYMAAIFEGRVAWLRPLEMGFYRLAGINEARQMGWQSYAIALLLLSVIHFGLLYAILRLQYYLPFNPLHIAGMSPRLAFNTAASFSTNTNWQAYVPEQQISNGAQMLGLCVHMFLSAAAGIAAAAAVMRAFTGGGLKTLGNFYTDLTRITLYLLIPGALIAATLLVLAGAPQTFAQAVQLHTLQSGAQPLAIGPVAFQEAIKELGTNGGGFFNANSAHPFENPSAWTNLLENWLLLVIGFALPIAFGHMVKDKLQGRTLMAAMAIILALGCVGAYAAEAAGNPQQIAAGVQANGNWEGKEMRFGIAASTTFNVSATGTSTGAVDSFTDSYTPLGGEVPLFLMQLGEVTPGGVGSGFYTVIVFALLSVFVAGLMVGRTPEYLGKKVQAKEIKLAMLGVLILTFFILAGAGFSLVTPSGVASLANGGPHGLSEMLYGWTSATENNGSAFAGLSADTPLLDYGLGAAMLFGRFAFMVPVLAIAGSLAAKPKLAESAGTFPTTGPLFTFLLIGVIIILGGLQFMPADTLGPIAEHFLLYAGKSF